MTTLASSFRATSAGEGDGAARRPATVNAVALIGGAVALALARALTNDGGTPAERLHQVAGHQTQVMVSALLAIAGFAALIPGLFAVADRVTGRGARLAGVGSALTLAGCVGFSVLAAIDAIPVAAATHVQSQSVMVTFVHQLDNSPAAAVIGPVAVVGFFAGPFLVTLAARRAGLVAAWLPWAVLVGVVLQPVGLAMAGPGAAKHLLDIACQLVLLAAFAALARTTLLAPPAASADAV